MTLAGRGIPLLFFAAAVLTTASFVGTAIAPTLLTYHPLLLIALSPIDRHMVLVAPSTPLVAFVLVSAVRRSMTCALWYGFGRVYGQEGIAFLQTRHPRTANATAMLQRSLERAAPLLLLLSPWPIFCGALAGVARIGPWLFITLAVAGQLIWARIAYRLGEALSKWITPITAFLHDHVLSTTLVCVAFSLLYAFRKRHGAVQDVPSAPVPAADPALVEPESSRDG
jgi:membrane protein DedA with SNARE-associated domain